MRLGGDEAKSPCLQIAFLAGQLGSVPRPHTAFPHAVQLLGPFRRLQAGKAARNQSRPLS